MEPSKGIWAGQIATTSWSNYNFQVKESTGHKAIKRRNIISDKVFCTMKLICPYVNKPCTIFTTGELRQWTLLAKFL